MKFRPKDNCFKNSKYEKWIRSKPCLICGMEPVQGHHLEHARRNCYLLLPLCVEHHLNGFPYSYHELERDRFEEHHRVNLDWVVINQLSEFIDQEI